MKKEYIQSIGYLLNPPFEFYCPSKTASVKKYLTDDQISVFSKFIIEKYTETNLKDEEKLKFYKKIYQLVTSILLVYKNKELLYYKIKLAQLFTVYDDQTNPIEYQLEQAASLIELGNEQKGKSIYQEMLASDPDYAFSANDFIFKGNYRAIEHPNRVAMNMIFLMDFIKVDPNYAYPYYTIGRILEEHFPNETETAMEYYSKAESLIKNDESFTWHWDCLYRLARILSIDGKFQQALTAINKSQAIESSSPKIGLEKGRILKSCGQVTLAFVEFERAQKLINKGGNTVKVKPEDIAKLSDAILKEKEELLRYFGSKIMQDQVDKVKEVLDYDSTAQMKKDMAKIHANQLLKDYYEQFVFCFSSLYGTSQVVISGQVTLDTGNIWLDLGSKALSFIPLYGDTIESVVSGVAGQLIGADMKKKARQFCALAANQSELDITVSYIARMIVLNPVKRRRILKLECDKQVNENVSQFWNKISLFYTKFKSVAGFEEYSLRSNTPAAKMALKDTANLISSMIKDEALLKKTSEVRNDEIIQLFFNLEEEELEKASSTARSNDIIPVKTVSARWASCFPRRSKEKM